MTPAAELLEQVLGPIVERAVARAIAKVTIGPKAAAAGRVGELTAKAIASDLGVSVSSLWRWRRAGTFIEPRQTGAGVRYDAGEYEEWKRNRDRARLR